MPGEEKCELVMEKLYALNANITCKSMMPPPRKSDGLIEIIKKAYIETQNVYTLNKDQKDFVFKI